MRTVRACVCVCVNSEFGKKQQVKVARSGAVRELWYGVWFLKRGVCAIMSADVRFV